MSNYFWTRHVYTGRDPWNLIWANSKTGVEEAERERLRGIEEAARDLKASHAPGIEYPSRAQWERLRVALGNRKPKEQEDMTEHPKKEHVFQDGPWRFEKLPAGILIKVDTTWSTTGGVMECSINPDALPTEHAVNV